MGANRTAIPTGRDRRSFLVAGLLVLGVLLGTGCGDDDGDEASGEELQSRLPAAQAEELGSDLGLQIERDFIWDNATDFVVQGIHLPEATAPSGVIDGIEDADFEGGAGFHLTHAKHEVFMTVDVARFGSDEDASEARDVLHKEDLKQPCFAACAVSPTEYEAEGIPGSTAAHHAPKEGKLPPGLFPFEGFLAEVPIGNDLYVVQLDFPPGAVSSDEFDRVLQAVYDHAAEGAESG